jgi:hypothetical protein
MPHSKRQWLEAPSPPPEPLLESFRAELLGVPEIAEAWLVHQLVTPEGGEQHEQTCVALALDAGDDPPPEQVAEYIARLTTQPSVRALGVRSWILVNAAIRPRTEEYGLKIYSRPAPTP